MQDGRHTCACKLMPASTSSPSHKKRDKSRFWTYEGFFPSKASLFPPIIQHIDTSYDIQRKQKYRILDSRSVPPINDTMIPANLATHEHTPIHVVRSAVGNTSGVLVYVTAQRPAVQKLRMREKQTIACGRLACVREYARARVRAYVRVCVRMCKRACVQACVRVHVCACVNVPFHACKIQTPFACVCECAHAHVSACMN